MKKIILFVTILSFFGCAPTYQKKGPTEPVSKMSNFDYDLAVSPMEGNKKALSDFKGKKISIYYLSAMCPHCKYAMPKIEKARELLDSLGYEDINICIKYNTVEQ